MTPRLRLWCRPSRARFSESLINLGLCSARGKRRDRQKHSHCHTEDKDGADGAGASSSQQLVDSMRDLAVRGSLKPQDCLLDEVIGVPGGSFELGRKFNRIGIRFGPVIVIGLVSVQDATKRKEIREKNWVKYVKQMMHSPN